VTFDERIGLVHCALGVLCGFVSLTAFCGTVTACDVAVVGGGPARIGAIVP